MIILAVISIATWFFFYELWSRSLYLCLLSLSMVTWPGHMIFLANASSFARLVGCSNANYTTLQVTHGILPMHAALLIRKLRVVHFSCSIESSCRWSWYARETRPSVCVYSIAFPILVHPQYNENISVFVLHPFSDRDGLFHVIWNVQLSSILRTHAALYLCHGHSNPPTMISVCRHITQTASMHSLLSHYLPLCYIHRTKI